MAVQGFNILKGNSERRLTSQWRCPMLSPMRVYPRLCQSLTQAAPCHQQVSQQTAMMGMAGGTCSSTRLGRGRVASMCPVRMHSCQMAFTGSLRMRGSDVTHWGLQPRHVNQNFIEGTARGSGTE